MTPRYLTLLCLYLGGLLVRATYEHFKKAGRLDSRNPLAFGVVLVAMCLLWASWFALCPMDPVRLTLPAIVRWTGLGAFALGVVMAVGALVQLRGVENISHLATAGLFSRLRHPMYTGFILWLLGWPVFHGAPVSFAAGLVGVGNVLYWRGLEERDLESRYGDAYREYRRKTWF